MSGHLIELIMLTVGAQAYLSGDFERARRIISLWRDMYNKNTHGGSKRQFIHINGETIIDSFAWLQAHQECGAFAFRLAYFPSGGVETAQGYILRSYNYDDRLEKIDELQYIRQLANPNPSPWAIIISSKEWEEYWWPYSDFVKDRRMWVYTYNEAPVESSSPHLIDIETSRLDMIEALKSVCKFAGDSGWVKNHFAPALASLQGESSISIPGFAEELQISEDRMRLIRAVMKAWVFGGMGSWTDGAYEDRDAYEAVTTSLYTASCFALVAAVNHGQPESCS